MAGKGEDASVTAPRYADAMGRASYAIGLGGNVYSRWGPPERTIRRALSLLKRVRAVSTIQHSAPMGPSRRRYANAVAVIETRAKPPRLLRRLKRIERALGRRPGRRWGARVIDLDILWWSDGVWASPAVTVPHPALRTRDFVLGPLAEVAPDWRDPLTGLTPRQLHARLTRPRPLNRRGTAGRGP